MSTYTDQAYDCLDEHETRYRRLDPEQRRAARAWRPEPEPGLDVQMRDKAAEATGKLLEAVKAREWGEVVRWATVMVAVDAQRDLVRQVCDIGAPRR